ncbi:MAG: translation initiation factor IF-2 N-terminal domain-containing protein, partial [Pirellulales bacterium]|nr:translation initiation factor IF-2 N-terminal domain-containing protein [Pirellulales bacterium]
MAVRIYSLAKELKLDSKDLVDMLPKAGISGKGSALASLTDEEEVKFRDFFARKSRPAERPSERPLDRLERPGDPAGERVLKDLTRPKPAPLAKSARPVSPAQKAPPAGDAPAPAPAAPAGTSPPVTPAREPSVPTDPAPRLDPVSPTIAAERSTSATVADKSSSSDDGGMDSKPMAGNTPLAPPSPGRP